MKGMNLFILALCGIPLFLCGCAPDTSVDDSTVRPIGFSSAVLSSEEPHTRGEVLTDIDKMYVFASFTGAADWTPATHSFNFFYDQLVEKKEGAWTYSPTKYWPANGTDKLSFFAYAPAGAKTLLTVSAVNVANPVISYTLPVKESEKQDFLVASELNRTNVSSPVAFTMRHALTQVKIMAKNADTESTDVSVSALSLAMPGSGKLSFAAAGGGNPFSWDFTNASAATITADVTVNGTETVPATKTVSLGNSGAAAQSIASFFLLPVGDPSPVVLTVTYTITKSAGSAAGGTTVTMRKVAPIPATTSWTPSVTVLYTVHISDDRLLITMDGVTVGDFTDSPTGLPDGDISAT